MHHVPQHPSHLRSLMLYAPVSPHGCASAMGAGHGQRGGLTTDVDSWNSVNPNWQESNRRDSATSSCTKVVLTSSAGRCQRSRTSSTCGHRCGPFSLGRPDVTYVATWKGFVYVAFVITSRAHVGWRVSASLDARGFVEDDLFKALVEVTQGWFAFLDQCCSHFRAKLQPVVTWADISSDELSRYLHCGGTQLPSFWVYPQTV